MSDSRPTEAYNIIFNFTWNQKQKRREKIKKILSSQVNEKPMQQTLEEKGYRTHLEYYQHLDKIQKHCNRYNEVLVEMNHNVDLVEFTNSVRIFDKIINGWQTLWEINEEFKTNVSALPIISDERPHLEQALMGYQDSLRRQLKLNMCIAMCTFILLVSRFGSNYFILLFFGCLLAHSLVHNIQTIWNILNCYREETDFMKAWLQLEQEIKCLQENLYELTEFLGATLKNDKSLWEHSKLTRLDTPKKL